MPGGLFDHFEEREQRRPPPPAAFSTPAAGRDLRWATAARVMVGVALVLLLALTLVGPALAPWVAVASLTAIVTVVAAVLARASRSVRRLAALEAEADPDDAPPDQVL